MIIPPMASPDGIVRKKINFGCYIGMFHYGWENTDVLDLTNFAKSNGYRFSCVDTAKPLVKYGTNSTDLIFSSHMLEHLTREDGFKWLKECFRILKPGGIIRIAVPDTDLIARSMINRDTEWFKHFSPGAEACNTSIERAIEVILPQHLWFYNCENLETTLGAAGFSDIHKETPFTSSNRQLEGETIVSHPSISLVMEATK